LNHKKSCSFWWPTCCRRGFGRTKRTNQKAWLKQSPARFDGPPTCCQGSDSVELKGRTKRPACSRGLHILSHNVLSTHPPNAFVMYCEFLWLLVPLSKDRHFGLLCPLFFLLFLLKKISSKLIYFHSIKNTPQVNSTLKTIISVTSLH
jgi:hypothetical protein